MSTRTPRALRLKEFPGVKLWAIIALIAKNPHMAIVVGATYITMVVLRMILDPMAESEFVLRRPAIAALAQGLKWVSPDEDPRVIDAFDNALTGLEPLAGWSLAAGDPLCLLANAELELTLRLPEGLDQEAIDELLQKIAKALAESFDIAELVDSLRVKLAAA